jgi:hypothetical protein
MNIHVVLQLVILIVIVHMYDVANNKLAESVAVVFELELEQFYYYFVLKTLIFKSRPKA